MSLARLMPRLIPMLLGGWLLAGLGGVTNAMAQTLPPASGSYTRLPMPERYSRNGQVEVVEVFSYACLHCAQAAVQVDQQLPRLPPGVAFKLMPAMFSTAWLNPARGFYVARQLHRVEATHLALFKAIWVDHLPWQPLPALAGFYAGYGIDPAQFMRLAQSPPIWQQMRHDAQLAERWGIDSTPSFVVNGRYKVTADGNHSVAEMLQTVQWLVAREMQGSAAPHTEP